MTKAGRKSDRSKSRPSLSGCWLDLFEKPCLSGTIRRLHGPAQFRDVTCRGSVIVGPGARLVYRGGVLEPGQVVARLRSKLADFELVAVKTPSRQAQRP
jgi:hypothetical protein